MTLGRVPSSHCQPSATSCPRRGRTQVRPREQAGTHERSRTHPFAAPVPRTERAAHAASADPGSSHMSLKPSAGMIPQNRAHAVSGSSEWESQEYRVRRHSSRAPASSASQRCFMSADLHPRPSRATAVEPESDMARPNGCHPRACREDPFLRSHRRCGFRAAPAAPDTDPSSAGSRARSG